MFRFYSRFQCLFAIGFLFLAILFEFIPLIIKLFQINQLFCSSFHDLFIPSVFFLTFQLLDHSKYINFLLLLPLWYGLAVQSQICFKNLINSVV